ncbi:hypothetical protein BD324DRAFT_630107 [Kockovaella imperatae]|uniref:Uncharacterized protein n=1 Tax=Kockovaella imperatae TaxID=4999 RepID=A0A1Y1UDM8_9TREE|nr:hypothetical protein BD324DRAFT_630107 [Kockovaella imperatae]ORX36089.1 hypothetical protein BD324DRAFT_630107 [Kockovaella imperatae]
MRFSTRNAFYFRASNYRVIPLFLYLDERHVDWMSDTILQLVIQELQPKMPELLLNGKFEKKHKVYVERGEGYQYCYFLRTTTRTEVVLLKQKSYSLRPPTPPPRSTPLREASARSSRKRKNRSSRSRSRSVSVAGTSTGDEDGPEGSEEVKDEPPSTPRVGGPAEDESEDVDIKDWKPDVDVSYKGFGTSSVQLVLIIEPYPPLPASQYAPPSSRLSTRSASIATSRSRSRQVGTGLPRSSRYSTSSSVLPDDRSEALPPVANMRNPTRSISATPIPNSRRGGTASTPGLGGQSGSTPFGRSSVTPFAGRETRESTGRGIMDRSATPLFIRADTDFDEEDEEAHEEYTAALKEGRLRLPSVSRPAGTPAPDGLDNGSGRRSVRRSLDIDDDEDDVPESLDAMSQRLVRSSEIEERFTRVQGGWEEREEGEESAVMGREEPGD